MEFSKIEKLIDEYIDEIVEFRRDIHSHPELGGNEVRTSQKIIEKLKNFSIDFKQNIGGYGVLGIIKGAPGKTILLRGDMDALPLNEKNNLNFKSQNKNVMHACGHDIHSAILLGTAIILNKIKDSLNGNVKFMFQPNEEVSPIGGSKPMIEAGILENPTVDEAYGLHVFELPTGKISLKPGVVNSKSDRITIEIFGKSSHGSLPSEGKDAIIVAANLISSIQTIISRNLNSEETAIISIGTIEGGTKYNVISDYVKLEGTIRTFNKATAKKIRKRLETIIENICSAYDCQGKLTYQDGYDFIYNDEILSNNVINSVSSILGSENVILQKNPVPIGEDFSYISQKVPSVFLWLGTEGKDNKGMCTLHNSNFIADENSIRIGIKVFCKIVIDSLTNN